MSFQKILLVTVGVILLILVFYISYKMDQPREQKPKKEKPQRKKPQRKSKITSKEEYYTFDEDETEEDIPYEAEDNESYADRSVPKKNTYVEEERIKIEVKEDPYEEESIQEEEDIYEAEESNEVERFEEKVEELDDLEEEDPVEELRKTYSEADSKDDIGKDLFFGGIEDIKEEEVKEESVEELPKSQTFEKGKITTVDSTISFDSYILNKSIDTEIEDKEDEGIENLNAEIATLDDFSDEEEVQEHSIDGEIEEIEEQIGDLDDKIDEIDELDKDIENIEEELGNDEEEEYTDEELQRLGMIDNDSDPFTVSENTMNFSERMTEEIRNAKIKRFFRKRETEKPAVTKTEVSSNSSFLEQMEQNFLQNKEKRLGKDEKIEEVVSDKTEEEEEEVGKETYFSIMPKAKEEELNVAEEMEKRFARRDMEEAVKEQAYTIEERVNDKATEIEEDEIGKNLFFGGIEEAKEEKKEAKKTTTKKSTSTKSTGTKATTKKAIATKSTAKKSTAEDKPNKTTKKSTKK